MDNPTTAPASSTTAAAAAAAAATTDANANAATIDTTDASPANINATATAANNDGIPTLHHLNHSQSLRILWALEELAAAHAPPYVLKTYKRHKARAPPELKAIFPLGASPILVIERKSEQDRAAAAGGKTAHLVHASNYSSETHNDDENDTSEVVTESRLILQYLTDHYSRGIWTPTTEPSRRRNDYFQEFATATLAQKVDFVMVFDILPPHVPWVIRPLVRGFCNAIASVYKGMLAPPFQLMEDALSGGTEGEEAGGGDGRDESRRWFAGERLGQADILMSWPMDMAVQRGYFDEKLYPKVAEWRRRVVGRPAYQRALQKTGEYDLVTFGF